MLSFPAAKAKRETVLCCLSYHLRGRPQNSRRLVLEILLPEESHGRRSLVGYSPWGRAKSRTRLSDFTFTFHFHALEKEMATHSCLENPRDRGMCWVAVYGVAQSRTRLTRLGSSSSSAGEDHLVLSFAIEEEETQRPETR